MPVCQGRGRIRHHAASRNNNNNNNNNATGIINLSECIEPSMSRCIRIGHRFGEGDR